MLCHHLIFNGTIVFRHLWVKGSHGTVTHNKSEWFLIFSPSTILLRPCTNNYERSKEAVFYQHICVCHSGQINTVLLFLKNRSQGRLNNDLCFHFPGVVREIQQNIQMRLFWKGWKRRTAFTSYTKVALRHIAGQLTLLFFMLTGKKAETSYKNLIKHNNVYLGIVH